jgi:DnaK suppressor protein
MATKKKAVAATTATNTKTRERDARYDELKQMLEDRRREILSEVQSRIKDVRSEGAGGLTAGVVDAEETSVADIQEDIELALIQMKAETLTRINEALGRLEENTYGRCNECGQEISQPRLRALPFAIRCKDCEEARERAIERERQLSSGRSRASLFLDLSS